MIGKSNYRETGSDKDQFYFEIIGTCVDDMFNQESYICLLLPKHQKHYKMGDKPFVLRKCLFGDKNNLYSITDYSNCYEQLSLFDF